MQGKVTKVAGVLPGPKSSELLAGWKRHEADATGFQAPVVWQDAKGAVVTDVDGNKYIDWTSGVLVANLGHCHPRLVAAVRDAVGDVINSYEFPTPRRIQAAEALTRRLPKHLDRCFFLTTGSEATEACMRIMKRKTGNYEIIGFHGGFHGRTHAAASAGGIAGVKRGFGPSMPGVIRAPFPYPYRSPVGDDPAKMIDYYMTMLDEQVRACSTGSLAGMIVEPYLGTAGFIFPPEGYLTQLEKWCRDKGILFTLDEVQSSYGRTGRMWATEWENLTPDLLAIGKGIGNGIPTSAVAARSDVIACMGKGELGSTVGGNPLSSAAVVACLQVTEEEKLVENSAGIGALMIERLRNLQQKSAHLGDVRGKGLVIGLEIVADKKTKTPSEDLTRRLILACANKGLLIGKVGLYGNVIRVAPPLCISEAEALESLEIMEDCMLGLNQ
jgi:4-aminobutyrate aminotransferase/(S)-3-amino-2-methylpropionate transaminase